MSGLAGETALVTGAGSGIGRAIAIALARAGASVGLAGRTRARLEETAALVAAAGGRAAAIPADVTVEADAARAADETASRFGALTIVVNDAGRGASAPLAKTTLDSWNEMLAVNLTSVFLVTRAALPHLLRAGRGRVVNVASVAGLRGYPYVAAYCAAKHGVVGLTRALAVELAPKNVTVNAVCPGYVDTPMTAETVRNVAAKTGKPEEAARAALEAMNPQRRLFTPEEVAEAVLFLCGAEAKGISGQALPVCGGETAG